MKNECEKCGSNEFYENDDDGYQYCVHCQTQSQGFAKEIADNEYDFDCRPREIRITASQARNANDGDDDDNGIFGKSTRKIPTSNRTKATVNGVPTSWTTYEAYNMILLKFIEDFFTIIESDGQLKLTDDLKRKFKSITMQLWFKYLRESELAFTVDEHLKPSVPISPFLKFRDTFILSNEHYGHNDSEIILPYSKHLKTRVPTPFMLEKSIAFDYGHGYHPIRSSLALKKTRKNDEYFNEKCPSQFEDPRRTITRTKRKNLIIHRRFGNNFLYENAVSSTKLNTDIDPSNTFMKFVHRLNSSQESADHNDNHNHGDHQHSIEVKSEPQDSITVTNAESQQNQQQLINDDEFTQIKLRRMSRKLQFLNQTISLQKCQRRDRTSPFYNDIMNGSKILAFLYTTIRLFNFQIFASDLIRWCRQHRLNYHNLFENFLAELARKSSNDNGQSNENGQRPWITNADIQMFMLQFYPRHEFIDYYVENIIIHCNLERKQFPRADIYRLIQRYLYDLNLPNSLLLIIKYRYNRFIETKLSQSYPSRYDGDNVQTKKRKKRKKMIKISLPSYELIAAVSIISILNDLFDIQSDGIIHNDDGDSTIISGIDTSDKFNDNEFNWNEWLRYSTVRWNLIQFFHLNLQKIDQNVLNLNETLSNIDHVYEFFRHVNVGRGNRVDQNCPLIRFELKDLFELIYFNDWHSQWKSNYHRQRHCNYRSESSPFYPLISTIDHILAQTSNTYIHDVLSQNFRQKSLLSYVSTNAIRNNHRKFNFNQFKQNSMCSEVIPDRLRLLLELSTYETSISIDQYSYTFRTAQLMAKNVPI